jgi:anti-anti-sigma factor
VTVSIQNGQDGLTRLVLSGHIDAEALEPALGALGAEGKIIANLAEVTFLSPQGLGLFVRLARKLGERAGRIVFLSPQPVVEEVITVSGVDGLIMIFHDEAAATASLLS